MYPKYYKNSNESSIFCFLVDWVVRKVLNIYIILLKYPTFENFVFTFLLLKVICTYKFRISARFGVRLKSLNYTKLRQLSILCINYTFWGQNKLKNTQSTVCQSTYSVFIVLGIYNFGFSQLSIRPWWDGTALRLWSTKLVCVCEF